MAEVIQPSFARGEIGPALYGRVDLSAYRVALRTALNAIVHAYGGVSNRPGLKFIAPVRDHTYAPILIPFKHSVDDTYILEFGDFYMRPIRNDAHVVETAVAITGATAATPVVVTAASHGYSNGDAVYITGVVGMTELNGRIFIVANKTTHTFELTSAFTGDDIVGAGYAAYGSAGTVARLYTVVSPYAIADLREVKYSQSFDVMTMTHPTYPVQELQRSGHASWAFVEPTFEPAIDHPVGLTATPVSAAAATHRWQITAVAESNLEESLPALNTTARTITGATAANPVVITATSHGFLDGDEVEINSIVGMTELNGRRFIVANKNTNDFELRGEDGLLYTAYASAGTANQTFVRITNGQTATQPNATVAWTALTGARSYNVYRELNGIFGFVGSTQAATYLDFDTVPDTLSTPPQARNPFRVAGEYPAANSFYQQRRVLGGPNDNPDRSIFSKTGYISNFSISIPGQSDDAITVDLVATDANRIRHYVPGKDLIVLTSSAEWRVNSGQDSAFEAATIKQEPQTKWGASHMRPIVIDTAILFVEENESIVRTLGYSVQIDGYSTDDLTLFAPHVFEFNSAVDWAFVQSPDPIVHIVRSDGYVATVTFNQKQEVVAWTRWKTMGDFESVAAIRPSSAERDDASYFVVKRLIDGNVVRFIERTAGQRFEDVRDCFFIDAGLTYDVPVTITGASLANPVVITAAAHGFADGDEVDIFDILWTPQYDSLDNETQPYQLNGGRYTVANKTADTFELSGTDGSAFVAYVSGGTARKAVLTISGFEHLAGATVQALGDGNVVQDLVVSSQGVITLPRKFSRVHAGLKYICDIETLDVVTSPQGTNQAKVKRVSYVTVNFEKSRGLFIGPTSAKLTEMKQREYENMGDPTALLTGKKKVTLDSTWNTNGRILMRQRYPLPMTILSVSPDLDVGD